MSNKRILIIGQVFVDTYLDIDGETLVRLGGIFHAVRAYSALETEYALAFYTPEYLYKDICYYGKKLRAQHCYRLGVVDKSPNVMIVGEPKEVGRSKIY